LLVDQQVHAEFARGLVLAGDELALQIGNYQIIGCHHAFADAGGSAENVRIIEPNGDIAIRGGREVACVNPAAGSADFAAVCLLGLGVTASDGIRDHED
jgi:hypothetical protein